MSKEITREQLWEAGAQYGHQTKRWNPKMKPFIYGAKNKNHIIDLQQTLWRLEDVRKLVTNIGAKGEKIIFVGTKRSGKAAVKDAAVRSGNFFVNQRWLGGTLTNMKTISLRIKALWDIENEEKTGRLALRPKKEQVLIKKEKEKLEKTLGGIKQMHKLPAAMFVVDPKTDEIAVKEARKLRIPVIAICDTNVDPDMVDYIIPGNDDLPEAINVIVNHIVEVWADAAKVKMQPTTLKFVAPKKEFVEGERRGRFGNDRNQNNGEFKPRPKFDRKPENSEAPKSEEKSVESKPEKTEE
ncbi:30S ribosomal protein S2 [Spiroplasma endosymbiont of Panorpa germanica]|uniref:30S ribosomal protein S2 n=1 Tax=Spiroplasma endosymbiont of Panorpa germanica TaxID=3066314 RepID=UPI0030D6281E